MIHTVYVKGDRCDMWNVEGWQVWSGQTSGGLGDIYPRIKEEEEDE